MRMRKTLQALLKKNPDSKHYVDRAAEVEVDLAEKKKLPHQANDPVAEIRDADQWLKTLLKEVEQDRRKFQEAREAKAKAHDDWEKAGDRLRKRERKKWRWQGPGWRRHRWT